MTSLARRALYVATFSGILAAGLAVPVAQSPSRDASQASTTGTAVVAGRVVAADGSGQPIRRVTVTLQSAALSVPISAVSGDDGRFEIAGVAAGQYMVRASRSGYVDTVLGAPPGGFLGAPIAVADGERLDGVTIELPRGGVITGTIRTTSGRPVRSVEVLVTPIRTVDGQRRTRFTGGLAVVRTDDRGVYRQFGLPPGDYVVQVMVGMVPMSGTTAVRPTTADEVAWAERMAAAGSGSGVAAGTARAEPLPGRVVTPAPLYYPGTTGLDAAQVITLGPGEERSGIDLVMEFVPTARVRGTVRGLDGQPQAGATVRLTSDAEAQSPADFVGSLIGRGATVTDAAGAFELDEIPPGDYTLSAQAAGPDEGEAREEPAGAPNLMAMASMMFGRGGANTLHARAPIVVTGSDIEGVELRLAAGATITGRVVFQGTTDPPSASTMQVMAAPVSDSASVMEQALSMVGGASGQVSEDHTFTVRGVPPDRYRLMFNMPGAMAGAMFGALMPNQTWAVASIRAADGTDLADVAFDVEPGQEIAGVVVTVTDRPTVLTGRVIDAAGQPVSAFPIVVFSTDPTHWTAGSQRVQQARPASDGSYRITGLPAGQYYVGAVTTLELDDLYDASFLQQIVPIAFTIAIADGQTLEQDLRVGG